MVCGRKVVGPGTIPPQIGATKVENELSMNRGCVVLSPEGVDPQMEKFEIPSDPSADRPKPKSTQAPAAE